MIRVGMQTPSSAVDFKLLFDAIPGAFIVVQPDAPRFTVAAVSDSYLQAVAKTREAMLDRGLFEIFPDGPDESHAVTVQNVRESFGRVMATGCVDTLPVQRYDMPREGTGVETRHWHLISRPILDAEKNLKYILHLVEDVTARLAAEANLREVEDHHRYAIELSPQIPWTADAAGQVLSFSRKWLLLTGLTEAEARASAVWETGHAGDQPRVLEAWRRSIQTGEPYDIEHRVRRNDGTFQWMRSQAFARRDAAGTIVRWYGTTEDIDVSKRVELRNALLVRLDDAVRQLADPDAITQAAARLLGEHLGVNRCAYADVEDDEDTFNLTGDYCRGVASIVGRYQFRQFGEECLRMMRERRPYVVEDSETDERTAGVREAYRSTTIRAVICVPLVKEGRFTAAMAVHHITPRRWQVDEVELVGLVASRCWESIERTRVSRQLEERGQRYRFLAESIPQMVWTARPDGQLDYVSDQVTDYFATSDDVILGEGWLQWVHPEDVATTVKAWQHSIQTGERYEVSFRLLRVPDQAWRWHLVRSRPLLSEAGAVLQWFGTCTDIEDQKQAQSHFQQQWHLFDTALSNSPDFIYTFDLDGRFTYVNQGLLNLLQKTLPQAVGKTFFDLEYPPELAGRLQDQIQQVIATRQPLRDQTPYTAASGETGHYEYIFVPVIGNDGRVVAVGGATRDITEREHFAKELAASKDRLQQVFLQAPVAIVVLRGMELVVELANPPYQKMIPAREWIGRSLKEVVPEIGAEVWAMMERVMETGEPFVANEWLIPYDQDGDGQREDHWFNLVYHPLREADGGVSGIVAVLTEVTKQVLARKELERANRELEQFAYVASHDLQEPLRMVNIYTQLMLGRLGGGDAASQKYAGFIQQGVQRMESLIRDLLTYSQAAHDDETPVGMAQLSEAYQSAMGLLQNSIEEAGATVVCETLPAVRGDEAQLSHVFQNLLSNALKYRKADVKPVIHIQVEASGDHWMIQVKDNGIGFHPQYAKRIFGLFKRLHKDEYPGTGVGLAICQRVVERHGGRMWAEGAMGEGSTFYFTLPKA